MLSQNDLHYTDMRHSAYAVIFHLTNWLFFSRSEGKNYLVSKTQLIVLCGSNIRTEDFGHVGHY